MGVSLRVREMFQKNMRNASKVKYTEERTTGLVLRS